MPNGENKKAPTLTQEELGWLRQQIAPEQEQPPWYARALGEVAELPVGKQVFGALNWIHEKIDRPWAAAATSLWSPPLPKLPGESWMEHQLREYDAWESPRFVKGIAEVSPVWWVPLGSWLGFGARTMGKLGLPGARAVAQGARIATSAERYAVYPLTKPLEIGVSQLKKAIPLIAPNLILTPTSKLLAEGFATTPSRKVAAKLGQVPLLKQTIILGNPSAIVESPIKKGWIVYNRLLEQGDRLAGQTTSWVNREGNPFVKDAIGNVTNVTAKEAGRSLHWNDVFQHPQRYNLSPEQLRYRDDWVGAIKQASAQLKAEGVPFKELLIKDGDYVPRIVRGKGEVDKIRGDIARGIGVRQAFQKTRIHELVEEGINNKVRYEVDDLAVLSTTIRAGFKTIADKRLIDQLLPLGIPEKALVPKSITDAVGYWASQRTAGNNLFRVAQDALLGKTEIASSTLIALNKRFPGIRTWLRVTPLGKKTGPQALYKLGVTPKQLFELKAEARQLLKEANTKWSSLRKSQTRAREWAKTTPWVKGKTFGLPDEFVGVSRVGMTVPGLRAQVFPREIADQINKLFAPQGNRLAGKLSEAAAVPRFMMTGFDLGIATLHLLPHMLTKPQVWAKAMLDSFEIMIKPGARDAIRSQHSRTFQKMIRYGVPVAEGVEYMEAAKTGGMLARVPVIGAVSKPFVRQFEGGIEMAMVYMWESMEKSALRYGVREAAKKGLTGSARREVVDIAFRDLADHIKKITGVMSSKHLGIGLTQRQIESAAIWLAPRYTKSFVGLVTDIFQGGLRGKLARDSMSKMLSYGVLAHIFIAKSLGQEPNLDPRSGKFLTVEIAGQNAGPGTVYVAGARTLAMVATQAATDPGGFIKWDTRDNTLLRVVRSRTSVLTGAAWDTITGKNYIGEPIDTPLEFTKEVLLGNMVPFWAEQYISDYPRPNEWAWIGEIAGLRTWPLQIWELRNEMRDELAPQVDNLSVEQKSIIKQRGLVWNDLDRLQRHSLEQQFPELLELTNEATEIRGERGGELDNKMIAFYEAGDEGRKSYEGEVKDAQREVADKGVTWYTLGNFKDKVDTAGIRYRKGRELLNDKDGEWADVHEELDSRPDQEDTLLRNIAYNEYIDQIVASPDLVDDYGNYLYTDRELREEEFHIKYGDDIYNYTIATLRRKWEMAPLYLYLQDVRDLLEPYWGIQDILLEQNPEAQMIDNLLKESELTSEQYEQLRYGSTYKGFTSQLALAHRGMRIANPAIDVAICLFYNRYGNVSPLTPEAEKLLEGTRKNITEMIKGQKA